MKKILIASALSFLSGLSVTPALAQTHGGKVVVDEPMAAQKGGAAAASHYAKPTRFDFDDDEVEGGVMSPDGEVVNGVRNVRFGSLLKPRGSFVPELLKSVEGL
jgi:hypothetical protein